MSEHHPIIIHPDKIQPAPSRLYFFDANIWLAILSPFKSRAFMQPYVMLWQRLREYGPPCVVANAVVISEVMNRFLRLRFDIWRRASDTDRELRTAGKLTGKEEIDYKKHFRGSEAYKDALDIFLASWDEISYIVIFEDQEGESEIVPAMLSKYGNQSDFNDKYYIKVCKLRNLWLVSHDGDFYTGGITVVTANDRILETYQEMLRKKR